MAVLYAAWKATEPWALSLTPVWPTIDGPHHAYDLALTKAGETVYSRRHSGDEWLVNGLIWKELAYSFQHIDELIDAQDKIQITDKSVPWFYQPLNVHLDAYWLQVVLTGRTSSRGDRNVCLDWFLRVEPDPANGLERFDVVRFHSLAAECKQFGTMLTEECAAADRRRRELGLESDDDIDDDEEDESEDADEEGGQIDPSETASAGSHSLHLTLEVITRL